MAEMDFFPEQRNLEDLWLDAFPDGPEWENDYIQGFEWSFENLEETLEEGGQLYGKTVYLLEAPSVDCPLPPSDKIGINYVHWKKEEIVPMKPMKMAWVPYVPLEDGLSRTESLKTKIFTLGYTQQRSKLEHHETGRSACPILCDFDWERDDCEDYADENKDLPEDEKQRFKEFLKEKVRETKRELKQAKEARKKAIDDMDPKTRDAFENIKFYKFYPVKTPDTPDVTNVKSRYINKYYRNAHYLM